MTTTTKEALIVIGSVEVRVDARLASEAGWQPYENSPASDRSSYAYRRLAQALSEGLTGEAAVLRAIAIGEQRSFEATEQHGRLEVAKFNYEAARLEFEAAKIRSAVSRREQR